MIENIGYIQKLTSPNPFALVSSARPDGGTNLMALSWWTYVSNKPASVAVCVGLKAFTHELILEHKEFGLCLVDESLKQTAFQCGTCSGRDVDKVKEFDIPLIESSEIVAGLAAAHKVAFECKLTNSVDLSDHTIFIGEVVAVHTNPDCRHLFALDGYNRLDTV